MRFLRFDTEAWAALVADRLRQSGHELSSKDLAEIRRRVDSHAAYLPQLLPTAQNAVRAVGRQQAPSITGSQTQPALYLSPDSPDLQLFGYCPTAGRQLP